MVRSEAKQPEPSNTGDEIVEAAVAGLLWLAVRLARAAVRVAWWAVLFPMLSVPVGVTVWVEVTVGWPAAAGVAVVSAMGLVGWRLAWPASFRRAVSGRLWKRRRAWLAYRRPWPHVCALHGLTATLNDQVLVPRLARVRVGYSTDTVTVQMLYGQAVADWQAHSDALAHAFGAMWVRVRGTKPGWVVVDVHHTDTLATPIGLPIPSLGPRVDFERLPVGVTETGAPWLVRILGRHVLVAGATGSGKGSVVWSILTGIAPAIAEGTAQVWVIDPKGGMEFGPGQAMFARFAYDTGETTLALLRDAAAILTSRAARLRGVTRLHSPTTAEPLMVVVIDEIATLTAYVGDRKTRTEIDQLLGLLLSQGRAVGVSVVAAVQDPSKDVLAMRQLFPTRIALRLAEPSQVNMVLGDSARDRGGYCDQIPDTLPGVGYVAQDGTTELVKVRAYHVTDNDIDHLARTYRSPRPPADGDDTPAGPPDLAA